MPVTFGLQIPSFSFPNRPGENVFAVTCEIARAAEAAGFETVWLMDHLIQVPLVSPETDPILDCWTGLAGLAACTERIRLGTLVSAVGYRPPSIVAKMTASIDVISRGRLVVGLGGGWVEREHTAYGFDYPPTGTRLERLEEAIQILIAMWTQERPSFAGRHFAIDGAINSPKPVQRPHPPILVGGSGAHRTLRIAAQYAQRHNIAWGGPGEVARVLALLRKHCERLGRDYHAIRKSRVTPVLFAASERDALRRIAALRPAGETDAGFRARTLIGTPEQLAAQLQAFVDAGLDGFELSFWDVDEIEPLHRFMREVAPLVKPRAAV